MYSTPYETIPLKGLKIDKIVHALSVAKAEGSLKNGLLESAPGLYVVAGKTAVTETIPPFTQPLVITDSMGSYTVIDLRAFNNKVVVGQELKDPDGGAASLAIRSALLQTIWQSPNGKVLAGLTTLPMQVFSTWIGNVVSRVVGLDARAQAELVTMACWYWMCLFSNEKDMPVSEANLVPWATKISNIGPLGYDETMDVIMRCGFLGNIPSFAEAIRNMNTTKTDRVAVTTLYSVLSNGWFGSTDARQLVSIALEYPPVFISILYTAVTERGYRNSPISTIAKLFEKRNMHKDFQLAVDSAIRAYGV